MPSAGVLKELGDLRYTVYDVLPAFFNHEDPMATLGTLMSIFITDMRLIGFQLLQPLSKSMFAAPIGRTHCSPSTIKMAIL